MSNDKLAPRLLKAIAALERTQHATDEERIEAASGLRQALSAHEAEKQACQGANCGATDGVSHSRECIEEAAATQGWTPTEEDFANCPPQAEKQAGPVAIQAPAPAPESKCPECGSPMSHDDGEAWEGPSVGCASCGYQEPRAQAGSTSPAVAPDPLESERAIDRLTELLDEFADERVSLNVNGWTRHRTPEAIRAEFEAALRAAVSHVPVHNTAPPSPPTEQDKEDALVRRERHQLRRQLCAVAAARPAVGRLRHSQVAQPVKARASPVSRDDDRRHAKRPGSHHDHFARQGGPARALKSHPPLPYIIRTMNKTPQEKEDREREEWALGPYANDAAGNDVGCPHCGRMRLCLCPNGKHRCEKCNWCPELNDYAPVSD